jgi:energy-coupling factor transporter ATP-binding protein EcfA2
LNCLIGARGVGKSTFVDYLRIALDRMREEDAPATFLAELRKRIDETLPPQATVEVVLATRGGNFRIVYKHGERGSREIYPPDAENPDAALDVRALFPCRFLSQREIDHTISTGQATALRSLLDDLVREELAELSVEAATQVAKIQQIDARAHALRASLDARPALETNLRLARGELEQNTRIAELWPQWEAVQTAEQFMQKLQQEIATAGEGIREQIARGAQRLRAMSASVPAGQYEEMLRQAAEIAHRLYAEFATEVDEATTRVLGGLAEDGDLGDYMTSSWQPTSAANLQALQEAGFGEGHEGFIDVPVLARRVAAIETSLLDLGKNERQLKELEHTRADLVGRLRQIWEQETEVRRRKADRLMGLLRARPEQKPMVEIRLNHQGDEVALVKLLAEYLHDRRRLNEDDLRGILGALAPALEGSPRLVRFIAEVRNPNSATIRQMADRRRAAIYDLFNEEVLRKLELRRVPDEITLLVYRRDGTLAGPIDRVSAGQQGTAILNLVLADGDDPLIIDTPEEGLDSEGVYQELVPLFRQAKERRQIIVVTHNANIPVNADAEGIVALEASGFIAPEELERVFEASRIPLNGPNEYLRVGDLVGWTDWEARLRHYLRNGLRKDEAMIEVALSQLGERRQAEGRIKRFGTTEGGPPTFACGALDVIEVNIAVQQVMEGSREAFEQRREKYGY